ncbi:DUF982 domain-containing protein [Agrobacterium rosae]|uniref:DUF982 domain-containing protein n=1 Tax=Agrobacterium rosae TaxID=1972867 RepID=UPI003A806CBC
MRNGVTPVAYHTRDAHLWVPAYSWQAEPLSIEWKNSVSVRIGNGHAEMIKGPVEAFDALNNRWPAEHGPLYVEAKSQCSDAVARGSADEGARNAFIDAAVEATLLA